MTVIPVVVGALGTVFKGLEEIVEKLEIRGRMETNQSVELLESTSILRRVWETWEDVLPLRLLWKVTS